MAAQAQQPPAVPHKFTQPHACAHGWALPPAREGLSQAGAKACANFEGCVPHSQSALVVGFGQGISPPALQLPSEQARAQLLPHGALWKQGARSPLPWEQSTRRQQGQSCPMAVPPGSELPPVRAKGAAHTATCSSAMPRPWPGLSQLHVQSAVAGPLPAPGLRLPAPLSAAPAAPLCTAAPGAGLRAPPPPGLAP